MPDFNSDDPRGDVSEDILRTEQKNDKFMDALGGEAYGVFGRTGLTPSQLADSLKSCEETCGFWVKEHDRVRGALEALVVALDVNDEDGLTGFAPEMQAARAALEPQDEGDGPFTRDEVE